MMSRVQLSTPRIGVACSLTVAKSGGVIYSDITRARINGTFVKTGKVGLDEEVDCIVLVAMVRA